MSSPRPAVSSLDFLQHVGQTQHARWAAPTVRCAQDEITLETYAQERPGDHLVGGRRQPCLGSVHEHLRALAFDPPRLAQVTKRCVRPPESGVGQAERGVGFVFWLRGAN